MKPEDFVPLTPPEILNAFESMRGAEEGRRNNIGFIAERHFDASYKQWCKIVFDYLEEIGEVPLLRCDCQLQEREILLTYLLLKLRK